MIFLEKSDTICFMKILGYSERGIVSALFFEIHYSPEPDALLQDFLSRVKFPLLDNLDIPIVNSKILIEQSFSDFGDSDVLILIDAGDRKISLFLEAKVKGFQRAAWTIEEEYQKFIYGTKTQVNSSNLFTQLYHKVRMIEGLRKGGVPNLEAGIQFPKSASKTLRKIGGNSVVLKVVEKLTGYLDDTFYVAVLPDDPANIENFFKNKSVQDAPEDYTGWDISHYGHISWSKVETFCVLKNMKNSLNVFKHNEGQIYN